MNIIIPNGASTWRLEKTQRSTQIQQARPWSEDVYVLCAHPLHILRSHYSLHAAMQAGCMVERIHHLRTIFEVHWGRGWKLTDLCFMTCFTGTLPPPLSLPASSLVYTAIFNPIFQNWQPYIIHILLSPLFFSLFLSVFTHFLQSLCTSSSYSLFVFPPTCHLYPAPLCRKVARLLSGAPDKGSFYFWWGFEHTKNVSQCVWAIMIVDKLLRMNKLDKGTGGKRNDLTNTLEATLFTGHFLFPFYFQIKNEVMHIL